MTRKPLRMGARRRGDPLPTLGDLRKGKPKGANGVGRELQDFRLCNYDESDEQLTDFIKSIGTLISPKDESAYYTVNHVQFVFPVRNRAPTTKNNATARSSRHAIYQRDAPP